MKLVNKTLVFGVILLFICVGLTPIIDADIPNNQIKETSNDNNISGEGEEELKHFYVLTVKTVNSWFHSAVPLVWVSFRFEGPLVIRRVIRLTSLWGIFQIIMPKEHGPITDIEVYKKDWEKKFIKWESSNRLLIVMDYVGQ